MKVILMSKNKRIYLDIWINYKLKNHFATPNERNIETALICFCLNKNKQFLFQMKRNNELCKIL